VPAVRMERVVAAMARVVGGLTTARRVHAAL
jgi:hypothetical protein